VLIRHERAADVDAIRAVVAAAFDTDVEAGLVDALRAQADPFVSLVAVKDEAVVGHVLFTPVTLLPHPELRILGLAPMSVLPAHQRTGVGSALIRAGVAECQRLGFGAVIVLGHADYYPRFGFVPASRFGLRSEYDVADDVFMAQELEPGYLRGKAGTIRYHSAFAAV
jgi:putative acetyltransferase